MIKKFFVFILIISTVVAKAQLKPWQAAGMMTRGINIGNSLDATGGETSWGNPLIIESYFDDYKNAGFTAIRIPITWGLSFRTSTSSPYSINNDFLNRVEQIVDWALARNFIVIINAHHESWLKENFNETNLARFDSIWAQISRRFKNKSDHLLFEILNEPYPMSLENVNKLNSQILSTIRKTNPTRIVVFSGHMWSNADELIAAGIPKDSMLIGYYHSYDPYPFGLEGPGTFGSDADIAAVNSRFLKVKNWSQKNNIPVILSEFGATKKCEYNSRMCHYATITELAITHNIPFFVWDDGGDFQVYLRSQRKWNEIKDILIYTYPQSPNKLSINIFADTLIMLKWNNRMIYTDSIIVERKINSSDFVFYKKIGPQENYFIDYNVNTNNNYYYYRLKVKINDSTFAQSYPIRIQDTKITRKPFNGKPFDIPGNFEAENFDIGVDGVSYHDNDNYNNGNLYRITSKADIFKTGTNYYIANVDSGEWYEYTINILHRGIYKIIVSVSSVYGGGKFSLIFKNNHKITFEVDKTDNITNFVSLSDTAILDTGKQIMRLMIEKGPDFGINNFNFYFISYVDVPTINFDNIKVYPNPVKSTFNLSGLNLPNTIDIINASGIKIKSVNITHINQLIDIADLQQGIYFIKSENNNSVLKIQKI